MPRPSEEARVRKLVEADLAAAEAAERVGDIPVNLFAVSRRTHVHRGTLRRYGLDIMIQQTAEHITTRARALPTRERRVVADQLRARDDEIAMLKRSNEHLLARVVLAEANAQRLGIDPSELWRAVTPPPRSIPYVPTGRRRSA